MVFDFAERDAPVASIPLYYEVFNYEGDEMVIPGKWLEVVRAAFGPFARDLSEAQFLSDYVQDVKFDRNGFFLVTSRGDSAGTAFAWCDELDASLGQLHWVAVSPKHQGLGIGTSLASLVLAHHQAAGKKRVFLFTESFRHSAIRMYLALGFRPWPQNKHESAVWETLLEQKRTF